MKKVVIVGAGPAGMFAAQELIKSGLYDVTVFEQRLRAGGSGLGSDGKLNLHPKIGGDLTEFMPLEKAEGVINKIDETFQNYGVEQGTYDEKQLEKLSTKADQAGMKFIKIRQKRVGSDRLHKLNEKFQTDLKNKGVKFNFVTKVKDFKLDGTKITEVETSKGNFPCDFVISAPGRTGSLRLKPVYDKLGLECIFNPVDIGVRVEFPSSLMREIVEDYGCWDAKFLIRTPTFDDKVRTFCVCPYGFADIESYGDGLVGVNGYSNYDTRSDNTNLALLVTVGLTEPLNDTTEYGRSIARITNMLGGGKPLIQRYGDFKRHRRSDPKSIEENHVEPTLSLDKATPGDLGLAYPYRILVNILEGLEKLNTVIPGLAEDSTLLYGPEIKFYARRIITIEKGGYKTLQTNVPNLFVAGDGAGVSRGIVGAAASGMIAAREIIQLYRKLRTY